jgi:hypothetical protein
MSKAEENIKKTFQDKQDLQANLIDPERCTSLVFR